MVGLGNVIKIGDFGLARQVNIKDYYRFERKGKCCLIHRRTARLGRQARSFWAEIQYQSRLAELTTVTADSDEARLVVQYITTSD
jgi:hypothetical protein